MTDDELKRFYSEEREAARQHFEAVAQSVKESRDFVDAAISSFNEQLVSKIADLGQQFAELKAIVRGS
jgi:flagellar capping protein FliD